MKYTSDDIMSELFNLLGITMEDVERVKKECEQVEKKKPEVKKDPPKKDYSEVKMNYTNPPKTSTRNGYCAVEAPASKPSTEPYKSTTSNNQVQSDPKQIAKDVYTTGDSSFVLLLHARNAILGENALQLNFEENIDEMCFPGITNKQLLWVLYIRYMKDPKKFDLVKQLLATEL